MATMPPPQPIPDHVPEELVHDIGFLVGPEFLKDPYEYFAGLHDKLPGVFYMKSPVMGNSWMTIKHDLAFKMLRNSANVTTESTSIFPRDPNDWFDLIPQEIDAPEHRKFRNILDPYLSPKAVVQLEQDMRDLANGLIDQFIDKGECDFATDFARPLPVTIFLTIMGLPLSMTDQFVKWVVALIQFAERDRAVEIMAEIREYLNSVIAEKREAPDDKLISRVVHGQVDGRPLTDAEIYGFVFFLFIAGIDTVYAALNNSWVWMARNPDRVQEMIADPDNIDNQVEELLRMFAPTFSGRLVTHDFELGGVQLKKGDRLQSMLPACNYDPDVWENPREVRFDRPRKPILTFTGGIHACMGGHLARLEFKVALQEWLRRISEFRIKDGAQILYKPSGVIGPDSVPLVW
ncbi:MAG: cytochrome P450 [Sphingomonadaceae bacterium]